MRNVFLRERLAYPIVLLLSPVTLRNIEKHPHTPTLLKAITSPTSCGKPSSRRIQAPCSPRRHGVHEDARRTRVQLEVRVNSRCREFLRSCGEFSSCQFVEFVAF